MSLRSKLMLAQLPLALALVLLGALALNSIAELGRRSERILRENYRSVLALQRMKESIERIDSAAMFRFNGRPEESRRLEQDHRDRFEAELGTQEANVTEPGESDLTRNVRVRWMEYRAHYDRLETLPDDAARRGWYFSTLQPAFLAVKDAADKTLEINQDAMVMKSDAARDAASRLGRQIVAGFALALAAGLVMTAIVTYRTLRPVSALGEAVRRIGEGDLEMRVRADGDDEVARLAREFNTMADRLSGYRKSSLGEMLRAQLQMQAALDGLPDPLLILGPTGEILHVNGATRALLEIDAGKDAEDLWVFVPAAVKETVERLTRHVLGGKGPYVPRGFDEAVAVPLAGGERHFLPRATPVYGERRDVVAACVILQDVTRLRRFDELRNDVVATVAHEFRTPLTSLHMAIHLSLDPKVGPVTEKQADLLHAAREDCARLQALVDDLLDLSRIQTGKVETERKEVAARELIDAALAAHRTAGEERSIRIAADPVPADVVVRVDRPRVSLVLNNLLANAIRHTPDGGRIELRAEPAGDEVRFEVRDTGEGIPPEYRERVFDKFFQVPGAKVGGSGLGLTIAREGVLAHGGRMGVESDVGKGSTFWFTLPVGRR